MEATTLVPSKKFSVFILCTVRRNRKEAQGSVAAPGVPGPVAQPGGGRRDPALGASGATGSHIYGREVANPASRTPNQWSAGREWVGVWAWFQG